MFRSLPYSSRIKVPHCLDRKSTRLNSSHITISYAVFCLKKKTAREQALGLAHVFLLDRERVRRRFLLPLREDQAPPVTGAPPLPLWRLPSRTHAPVSPHS